MSEVQELFMAGTEKGMEVMIDINDLITDKDKNIVSKKLSNHVVQCLTKALDDSADHFENQIKEAMADMAKKIAKAVQEDTEICFSKVKVRHILQNIMDNIDIT
jgi:oligoribonuclease (3'-5' exoribonuclease)